MTIHTFPHSLFFCVVDDLLGSFSQVSIFLNKDSMSGNTVNGPLIDLTPG